MDFLNQLWVNTKTTIIAAISLLQSPEISSFDLKKLNLKDGFDISVAAKIPDARSLALSPSGTLFVANRRGSNVYAAVDRNNDFKYDDIYTLAKDLNMPNGIAFYRGDLYVAEVHRVLKFANIESQIKNKKFSYLVVYKNLPSKTHHGWRYMAFRDGLLYMSIGAPCNVCKKERPFATIVAIDLKNKTRRTIATGVRNSIGFDWHPKTGDLWFTDNGRDFMGDEKPPCELNRLPKASKNNNFGFPYCHGRDIVDPTYNTKKCKQFISTMYEFRAHIAPLGMRFYTGDMFPKKYKNQIFVAEHGSWNRSKKIGYKVSLIELNKNQKVISYSTFIDGFLRAGEKVLGRPVDIIVDHKGGLLISDDHAGLIYRVIYKK